jgi:FkbH-like protein
MPHITLGSTFTVNPLVPWLQLLFDRLGLGIQIDLLSYDTIVPNLLQAQSPLRRNADRPSVLALRVADWVRSSQTSGTSDLESKLTQFKTIFLEAAEAAILAPGSPKYIIALCPSDDALDPSLARPTEADLVDCLGKLGVEVIYDSGLSTFSSASRSEIYDPHALKMGHIPYTDRYFAALATRIVRALWHDLGILSKMIVVDCDNTLWTGVCGEMGPGGIELSEHNLVLQKKLKELSESGMLIALCSKNEESDVLSVFEQRKMPLSLDDVVAYKIDWTPKYSNVRSLTQSLDLGLDSVVFIDDNPVECAEMRTFLPQVITHQFPTDSAEAVSMLQHMWALDRFRPTAEDRARTRSYQAAIRRQKAQARTTSMTAFLDELEMVLEFREGIEDDIPRMSQMTMRTNQFNCTTIRRGESELRALLASEVGATKSVTVHLRDRFGNYGMVGLLLYRLEATFLHVDTFLMSCRVLRRGVEYAMIRHLGAAAAAQGADTLVLPFRRTARNLPALLFLQSVTGQDEQDKPTLETVFRIAVERAMSVQYDPDREDLAAEAVARSNDASAKEETLVPQSTSRQRFLECIAEDLRDTEKLLALRPVAQIQSTAVESLLFRLWSSALGRTSLDSRTSLDDLGADSIAYTRVAAGISRELGIVLSPDVLLASPSIGEQVEILETMITEPMV